VRQYKIQPQPRKILHLHDGRELVHVYGCDVTLSSSIAAGADATIITIEVPQQISLVVISYLNFLDDMTALGYVSWTVNINGVAVPNYNSMSWAYDTGGTPKDVKQDVIVPEGGTLTVVATNNSGFTYKCGAGVYGVYGSWKHNS